eukprot:1897246-Heterocapsa_arctica.AAC.1
MHIGMGHIVHGNVVLANEHEALQAAHWITENAAANGFRIPNAGERTAAFGMREYLTDMVSAGWLSEKDLVDVTGN